LLRDLAVQRDSRIEQGHLMLERVQTLISIPPKYPLAQVVEYIKGKRAIYMHGRSWQASKFHRRKVLGARSFVSTAGRDEKAIREYI
jgi:putative transposase